MGLDPSPPPLHIRRHYSGFQMSESHINEITSHIWTRLWVTPHEWDCASHFSYEWVTYRWFMSITTESVTSHRRISHVTHMSEVCHTHCCILNRAPPSAPSRFPYEFVWHTWKWVYYTYGWACYTCKWVTSHIYTHQRQRIHVAAASVGHLHEHRPGFHMNESCRHVWISDIILTK